MGDNFQSISLPIADTAGTQAQTPGNLELMSEEELTPRDRAEIVRDMESTHTGWNGRPDPRWFHHPAPVERPEGGLTPTEVPVPVAMERLIKFRYVFPDNQLRSLLCSSCHCSVPLLLPFSSQSPSIIPLSSYRKHCTVLHCCPNCPASARTSIHPSSWKR